MNDIHRRRFLKICGVWTTSALGFSVLAACGIAGTDPAADSASRPASSGGPDGARRIGIIGAGHIGGTLGRIWAKAGHDVLFASRHPEELQGLVQEVGPRARAGTPRDAVLFGDVVFVAVPYGALPQLGQDLRDVLQDKIVLDACNPIARRDGDMGVQAIADGAGITSARLLPGTRLVRGFNSISARTIDAQANRTPPTAIPLAGNDRHALTVVSGLVRDAGFEPVITGDLSTANRFQPGSPLYLQYMSADDYRKRLAGM